MGPEVHHGSVTAADVKRQAARTSSISVASLRLLPTRNWLFCAIGSTAGSRGRWTTSIARLNGEVMFVT